MPTTTTMFADFSLAHLPALFVGTAMTFGGLLPLLRPSRATSEFGFPDRIANAPVAWPVMKAYGTRTTIIGLIVYTLYFQKRYTEVDTVVAIVGFYAGLVDAYIVGQEGKRAYALFRLVSSWALGACGYLGLTAGP